MTSPDLDGLGWSSHFATQLDPDDRPARISLIHRDRAETITGETLLVPMGTGEIAVGDWAVHNGVSITRILDRSSLLLRGAAGGQGTQLIAANVDTLAIVTSCNADFNVARLERYLALAASAGCLPLIVLTKADLCDDPEDLRRQAEALSPLVTAITLNARTDADRLEPWCKNGQTLALVGSSGVGKTTLQNALTGDHQATQDIREDDAKGRHTTTARAMRPTLAGGWLIDTPGVRELRLAEVTEGIEAVFADVVDLAAQCKFTNCNHDTEPGCAVQAAIAAGDLDPDRLARWRKLRNEDRNASETTAQSRARHKSFTKKYRKAAQARRDR